MSKFFCEMAERRERGLESFISAEFGGDIEDILNPYTLHNKKAFLKYLKYIQLLEDYEYMLEQAPISQLSCSRVIKESNYRHDIESILVSEDLFSFKHCDYGYKGEVFIDKINGQLALVDRGIYQENRSFLIGNEVIPKFLDHQKKQTLILVQGQPEKAYQLIGARNAIYGDICKKDDYKTLGFYKELYREIEKYFFDNPDQWYWKGSSIYTGFITPSILGNSDVLFPTIYVTADKYVTADNAPHQYSKIVK